jgi:hypothetical protein
MIKDKDINFLKRLDEHPHLMNGQTLSCKYFSYIVLPLQIWNLGYIKASRFEGESV